MEDSEQAGLRLHRERCGSDTRMNFLEKRVAKLWHKCDNNAGGLALYTAMCFN